MKTKKDVEDKREEFCQKLSKLLDNTNDWIHSYHYKHKIHNLSINYDGKCTIDPEDYRIPRRWRKILKPKLKQIEIQTKLNELSFMCEVADEKYCMYFNPGMTDMNKKRFQWIKENGEPGDYIVRKKTCYILSQELAMAYKLKWY